MSDTMTASATYLRRMGGFSSTLLVVGGVIGAGIFLNPAVVAAHTHSGAQLLLAWVLGGVLTMLGALCFAELGARRPEAGGSYLYIFEAFGPLLAFLFGWTMLIADLPGSLAAVALIFGRYAATAVGLPLHSAPALGSSALVLIALVHARGISTGAALQNVLSLLKLGAVAALAGTGLWLAAPHLPAALAADPTIGQPNFAMALLPVLFAYGGFAYLNALAGEVRDPLRTLPRALIGGLLLVMLVYVLVNLGYLAALGHAGLARSEAPAAAVMRQAFGPLGERLIAAGIAVSTFGYCAVALGGAARVLQTIAAQGLFFRSLGVLHPRRRTPQRALIVLAGWSIVLALSGSFAWLLNYTTVVDWLGYAATIAALFWYRRRQPGYHGFRTPLYPLEPVVFIALVLAVVVVTVAYSPGNAGMGLLVMLLGLPVYAFWSRRKPA